MALPLCFRPSWHRAPKRHDATVLARGVEAWTLAKTTQFPEHITFQRLEVHQNPCNDYWEEDGQMHKQFPSLLFVGHGWENGRPVSLVWTPGVSWSWDPKLLLKVFDGDARRLSMTEHGSADPGGLLVERARTSWLPAHERPKKLSGEVRRDWRYDGLGSFTVGPWRKAVPSPRPARP